MLVKEKIYCVNNYLDPCPEVDWLGKNQVLSLEEADIVVFKGDFDISPERYEMYSTNKGQYTYSIPERDEIELDCLKKAIKLNKTIVGINRGLHLISVQQGAKIVQHMNHPIYHNIELADGTNFIVKSSHHQIVKPFNLPREQVLILGYAKGLSDVYLNGNNDTTIMRSHVTGNYSIEPEILYYPSIKAIGFQYDVHTHPIHLISSVISRNLVKLVLADKLPEFILSHDNFDELKEFNINIDNIKFEKEKDEYFD